MHSQKAVTAYLKRKAATAVCLCAAARFWSMESQCVQKPGKSGERPVYGRPGVSKINEFNNSGAELISVGGPRTRGHVRRIVYTSPLIDLLSARAAPEAA